MVIIYFSLLLKSIGKSGIHIFCKALKNEKPHGSEVF